MEHVAGHSQPITARVVPVPAKAASPGARLIVRRGDAREAAIPLIRAQIHPRVLILARLPAIAEAACVALLIACEPSDQSALRVTRVLGDNVDDAIDGVGAP